MRERAAKRAVFSFESTFSNLALAFNDKTKRRAEVAGRGWRWKRALLLLPATAREEAPIYFRLYFQSMRIAKRGIRERKTRARRTVLPWLLILLATAGTAGA